MEGRDMVRVHVRRLLGGVVVLGLAASLASGCRTPAQAPKTGVLKGSGLSLVLSRVRGRPREVYTGQDAVQLRVYADPEIVDLSRVAAYRIWARGPDETSWRLEGEIAPGEGPFTLTLPEGVVGLSASVEYRNGTELFAPAVADDPLVWLVVDRTPPRLRWVRPDPSRPIWPGQTVEIEWRAEDIRLARRPAVVEWSGDGGVSWNVVGETLPAPDGRGRFSWTLPKELPPAIKLRVRARDLAGREGGGELTLVRAGPQGENLREAIASGGGRAGPEAQPRPPQTGEPVAASLPAEAAASGPDQAVKIAETSASSGQVGGPASAGGEGATAEVSKAPPPEPKEKGAPGFLTPLPLEADCLRGGTVARILWTPRADIDPSLRVALEYSLDGTGWDIGGEGLLGEGGLQWAVPEVTAQEVRLRFRVLPEGSPGDAGLPSLELPQTVGIDSAPPEIRKAVGPERAGRRAAFQIEAVDPGCAGLRSIAAYTRLESMAFWSPLPESAVVLRGVETVELSLEDLREGLYEVYFRGEDAAGNRAPEPDPSSQGHARLTVDRTPPTVTLGPPALPWVSGLDAALEVSFDPRDAVPPLIVEGREPGSQWRPLLKLESLAAAAGPLSVPLPPFASRYELRVRLADAAGNEALVETGVRALSKPIELVSFRAGRSQIAYSTEVIRWLLHPAVRAAASPLEVVVEHRAGEEGEWRRIGSALPPQSYIDWELPPADEVPHQIRVRLLRGGEVIGEDVSPPFRIEGVGSSLPEVVAISEESMALLDRGRAAAARVRSLLESKGGASDPEALAEAVAEARARFTEALERDPANYHAAYEMARLLGDLDPEANAVEVERYLKRTVEIQPAHAQALNDLGALLIRRGDYERAIEYLKRSIAAAPGGVAHFNLGLAYLYSGNPAEARAELQAALAAGDGVPEAEVLYYTVYTYVAEGRMEDARRLYESKKHVLREDMRRDLETRLAG